MNNDAKNKKSINIHIMALITFLALVPLVYFIPEFIGQFLPPIEWLNVIVAVGIIVPTISYGVVQTVNYFYVTK